MARREQVIRASVASAEPTVRLLDVDRLCAGYGKKRVVFDLTLAVGLGEIVTVLGHNGAGKTTTLKTIFGMLASQGGRITYQGVDVSGVDYRYNVRHGMSFIPAEHFVFSDLSVIDNLRLGAVHERSAKEKSERLERIYEMFPILKERSGQRAGTMSGGQQRMLSLGIAVMSGPRLLLLDEPSLGLAPALVDDIFGRIRWLADHEGLSVLLVEQNVGHALRITDRFYVMRSGRVILEESADQMRKRKQFWDLF